MVSVVRSTIHNEQIDSIHTTTMANYTTPGIMNTTVSTSEEFTSNPIDGNESSLFNYENIDYFDAYNTIHEVLFWCFIPTIVFALVGNTLVIMVMTSKENRKTSSAVLFTVLAIGDMMIIILDPLDRILKETTNYHLKLSIHFTTFKTIILYTSVYMSSWMIVFLTVERVLCVTIPHRIKIICFKKIKCVLLPITVIVYLVYNIILNTVLLTSEFDSTAYLNVVMVANENGGFELLTWTDASLTFIVPAITIIVGAAYIIFRLSLSDSGMLRKTSQNSRHTTNILITSVFVFILTMSPYYVHRCIFRDSLSDTPYLELIYFEVSLFLVDLKSALNFYVYCLSGSKFRNDVKCLLRKCRTSSCSSSRSKVLLKTCKTNRSTGANNNSISVSSTTSSVFTLLS